MIRRLWRIFWSPASAISLGLLLIAGFVAGILFWGGLHWSVEATNTEKFCISCHEMHDNVYQEYKETAHYRNASGVGAICSDCHVPKEWLPKMIRKVQATSELYHHFMGTIDTPEKFEAHRATMAQRVWDTMEANDSLSCRNCHNEEHIDYSLMEPKAAKQMQEGLAAGDTCITCHKGIAHKMPDLSGGYKKRFRELEAMAAKQDGKGEMLYPIRTITYYLTAEDAKAEQDGAGQVLAASAMEVLERDGDAIHVQLSGWQQDQVDRLIYALRGQRIFEASLRPSTVENLEIHATETDLDTDLVWNKVSLEAWVRPKSLVNDLDPIWGYTKEMYNASCGTCHSASDPGHLLANQWIGTLKAMERFVSLDKEQMRILQKYLQLHAKDTGGSNGH